MEDHYAVKKIGVLVGTLFTFGSVVSQPTYTNAIGMKFQQIPGNVTFNMGKVTTDPNGVFWDGVPVHQVRISHAYYIGVTEVTNAQYELFQLRISWGPIGPSVEIPNQRLMFRWTGAEAFVAWLNQNYPSTLPGRSYRLSYAEAESGEYATPNNANNFSLGGMQSGAEELDPSDWYGLYMSSAQTDPS